MKAFDLEAAMRGEPIVTRDGRKARFVAHVPEAEPGYRLVVFTEEDSRVYSYYENGRVISFDIHADLFMATKKKIVWVNLYGLNESHWFSSKETADEAAEELLLDGRKRKGNKAWPLEIEE